MARLTRDKPELKVVDDQRGRPTSTQHLAAATLALVDRGTRGTLHVTDGGECTWYEFTVEIARLLGRSAIVRPCTTAEFPALPPARLQCAGSRAHRGDSRPMPDWRKNLAASSRRWSRCRTCLRTQHHSAWDELLLRSVCALP